MRIIAIILFLLYTAPLRASGAETGASALSRAQQLVDSGKYREAAEQFRKVIDSNSASSAAWFGLGKCYEALAADAFTRLENEAPESEYWLALIADSRMSSQQYRSAFFFYRKALEKNPGMRGVHVAISRVYSATGHQEWAAAEEQKELDLGLPDCEKEKLVCAFLEGRFLDAANLAAESSSPEGYYWQCQAYNQLALESFSRLAALPPSYEMHRLRAEIQENQGRYLEAVKDWKKALEMFPKDPAARRGLALSLFLSRDYPAADEIVQALLAQDPNSSQLNYLAGEIRLNQEKARESIPFLSKAVETEPDFTAAHASLGRALLAIEEPGKAIPHLQKAAKEDQEGTLHYQLARAYQAAGDRERAQLALQEYQERQKKDRAEKQQIEDEAQISPP